MQREDKRIHTTTDYELIDSGDGRKLERFGTVVCDRPDPQALWAKKGGPEMWADAQATFSRDEGGPDWSKEPGTPEEWQISINGNILNLSFSEFKHVGVFPEHAWQWEWITGVAAKNPGLKMLNLFGYTGAASVAGARAGMEVTHVDASKKMVERVKENAASSGLAPDAIRVVCEDALKYMRRLIDRGETFEVVVCDPPSFGRGPKGEVWKIEESLTTLVSLIPKLLSQNAKLVILNGYASGYAARTFAELLYGTLSAGEILYGDVGIQESSTTRILSTGIYALWQK